MSWPPFVSPVASTEAVRLNEVLVAIHWHMAILFALWATLLVYVLIRFRHRTTSRARYRGVSLALPAIAVGVAIAGEAAILVGSALPAWHERWNSLPANRDTVEVRVIGEQFAWNVHYPGPDRTFGPSRAALVSASNPLGIDRTDPLAKDDIGLLNVLTVPLNQTVVVHLSSRDVVHSFTLVDMRVKHDANPGMTTRTWFTATTTGTWDIVCSQLCGLGHYRMKGVLTVLTPEDWQQWQTREVALVAAR